MSNKYQQEYDNLIINAKNRILEGYGEWHHIIPEYFFKNSKRKRNKTTGWLAGNPDCEDNLVLLTPEEHFDAHQLLALIYPNRHGLINAALQMSSGHTIKRQEYGELKRLHAKRMRKLGRAKRGISLSENHKAKLRVPKSEHHKKQIGIANSGIPKKIIMCPHCEKSGGEPQMKQWHFNNCLKNPDCQRKEKQIITCPHCLLSGGKSAMHRWHFDNCEKKNN